MVRIIVINYDGGDVTLRCLDSLTRLDWPEDRLEVVMVDNASIDGLVWKVPRLYPRVRVVESLENEGFARGNNLAMQDLAGVDVVCLLNNDTYVEPGWLTELVKPLFAEPNIGATCSKMLFTKTVVGVEIDPGDSNVCLTNVRVDGVDSLHLCGFDERFDKSGLGAGSPTPQHWLTKPASVWIPIDESALPCTFSVEMFAPTPHEVTLRSTTDTFGAFVQSTPSWVDCRMTAVARVVNNAGGGIFTGWGGGDIGFRELDLGQYDVASEPFSFCGGAVALKADFLRQVGLFDPTYFLYYEDLDLAWRGRFHGWTYRYVPQSVVYHEHAFSSVEGSHFFNFWVDRNRRLTLIKNAPGKVALKALVGAVVWGLRDAIFPVLRAVLRFRRPPFAHTRYRLRQLFSLLKATPSAVRERRRLGKLGHVERTFARDWLIER